MSNVFIFTDIEIPFNGREKVFCMFEYAQLQSNKTVQHAFVRQFSKQSPTAMQIWTWHKKFSERLFVQEKRIWTTKSFRRDGRACSQKNLAKPKEIVMKNKSRNQDSTNNSLAHPEETLNNKNLQATTR